MESGKGSRIRRSASTVQDSSIFNDLSNLSPIKKYPSLLLESGSPCTNSQQRTSFRHRPHHPGSCDAEPCLKENAKQKLLSASRGVPQPSVMQSALQSIARTRESGSKSSVQVQPCSLSRRADGFLTDPLKGCDSSTDSPNLDSNQTIDPPQDLHIDFKEATVKVPVIDSAQKNLEAELAATITLPEQAREDPKSEKSYVSGPAEKNDKKKHIELPCLVSENANDLTEANLSIEPASGTRHGQHLVDQAATSVAPSILSTNGSGIDKCEKEMFLSSSGFHHLGMTDRLQSKESAQKDNSDHTPELLPETFDTAQLTDMHNENNRALYNETNESQMPYDCKEANRHQRGTRRRCLQFEGAEAGRKSTGNSSSLWDRANSVVSAVSPTLLDSSTLHTLNSESNMASGNKQVVNFPRHTSLRLPTYPFRTLESHIDKIDSSARTSRNSIISPMLSGIGLHLNRIDTAVATNHGIDMQLAGKDYSRMQVQKSVSVINRCLSQDAGDWLVPSNELGNSSDKITTNCFSRLAYTVRTNTELDQEGSQASVIANSHQMKLWDESQQLKLIDPHEWENKGTTQDLSGFKEFSQVSPRKKRKEEPSFMETEGCKRCNCKKSKCLKLYCDCFAAGVYCADSCSCQECFNKIEYEDTVMGTRQQIESRNPLAFAPKIVQRVTESPQNSGGDGNRTTPASARHKRGCNCKKSMCLKKYCECYQAGVGCSDGCRCEGCKNVFGKKEGCGEIIEVEHRKLTDEGWGNHLSKENISMPEIQRYISHAWECHSDHSQLAPSYHCLNQGKEIAKSQHPARRHLTASPKPDNSLLSQGNFNTDEKFTKTMEGNETVVPHCSELQYLEAETVVPFSPRWNELANMHSFTSLAQHPQSTPTASASSNDKCCSNALETQHGNSHVLVSSFRWHGSSITRSPQFGEAKFATYPGSDTVLYTILEDKTPDILKETNSSKSVKTSSPNQKQVSPPKKCWDSPRRSTSSSCLGSSRKIILSPPYTEPEGSDKKAACTKMR